MPDVFDRRISRGPRLEQANDLPPDLTWRVTTPAGVAPQAHSLRAGQALRFRQANLRPELISPPRLSFQRLNRVEQKALQRNAQLLGRDWTRSEQSVVAGVGRLLEVVGTSEQGS